MPKQKLNSSRQLDNGREVRRSNVEVESLHSIPTARQRKFWRGLCAEMRKHDIAPPPDPMDRVSMSDEIDKAIALLEERGVEISHNNYSVSVCYYPPHENDTNSVAKVRTVVEGRMPRRKPMNWNGLTPRKETVDG